MKKALLIVFLLGLTSCLDKVYFIKKYKEMCPEAATVPFETLAAGSTCNGLPLLFAVSKLTDKDALENADDIVEYLVVEAKANPNAIDPITGRNALMYASEIGNWPFARSLVRCTNPVAQDSNGNSFLHYLVDVRDFSRFSRYAGPALELRNAQGQTAAELAYSKKNYMLVWELIKLGAKVDFLKQNPENIDPQFFFNKSVELSPVALDDFGSMITKAFDLGDKERSFSLLHFAVQENLPNLFAYLLSRSVPLDQVSSVGSPLALAIQEDREGMILELLKSPRAVFAKGVLNTAMKTGNSRWVQALVAQGVPIWSYENLLLFNCERNVCFDGTYGYDSTFIDVSGNSFLMQIIYTYYRPYRLMDDRSPAMAEHIKYAFANPNKGMNSANALGQNFAHFFAYLGKTDDYGNFGNLLTDGFDRMINLTKNNGMLSQRDGLGMTPLHYWLVNEDRKRSISFVGEYSEDSRLKTLLSYTQDLTALNINRDSILSLAVLTGNKNLVKIVMNSHKDFKRLVNVPNAQSKTPLQLASEQNDRGIYDYLQKFK